MVQLPTAVTARPLLIVDDEPAICRLIGAAAQELGCAPQVVHDGAAFKAGYLEILPDVIVLDLGIPGCDGIELLRFLADRESIAQIVIISGHGERSLESARRLGNIRGLRISGIINKPIRRAELVAQLVKALGPQSVVGKTPYPTADSALEPEELAAAIRSGELILHYQPKIDLATNHLIGVEALSRWNHPVVGSIPPSSFIPLAETAGLMGELTLAVIGMATRQVSDWRSGGLHINVAVNVSASNLDGLEFADEFQEICQRHSCPCSDLTIELTEGATLAVIHLLDALTRLRIKGAHLSLDDFGTGYSSLVQLHELPFSEMKIDRSFVMGMDTTKECRTIVKSIIDLAHNLDLKVVAEGVETATALRQLKALGCDVAQGYFIARPMPAAYLPGWLEKVSSNSR